MISSREDEPSSQWHYSKHVTGNRNIIYIVKSQKPEKKLVQHGVEYSSYISKVNLVTYPDCLYAKTIHHFTFERKIKKKILGQRVGFYR